MFWINFEVKIFEFLLFRSIGVPFEDVLLTGHKNIHILKNIHFVVERSYRFPHRNHYGHHFDHASNRSHEQFLFENRAVYGEADVPHNADGANGNKADNMNL